MKQQRKFPVFFGFRIYFISTFMYFMLVAPIAGFLVLQSVPDLMEKNTLAELGRAAGRPEKNISLPNSIAPSDTLALPADTATNAAAGIAAGGEKNNEDLQNDMLSKSFDFLLTIALPLSFLLGFIFNYPFKRFLRRKRRGKPVSDRLHSFCKKFVLKVPWIDAGILGAAFVATLIYMIILMTKFPGYTHANTPLFNRFFSISLFASLLTILFVYYWQKHRVHIKYLEHFFSREELRQRIFKAKQGRIINRFWMSSAMTTLLPLLIVLVYLLMSFTQIKDLSLTELNEDQIQILFGRYSSMIQGLVNRTDTLDNVGNFFFVNVMDGLVMTLGIGVGIFASLIYILLFVKWTTSDIVYPVRELIYNMQKTGAGKNVNYTVVRSNDEIGELAVRFNEMTAEIEQYISRIEKINKAYYRFVPRQFLDFLQKDDITEVQLGDQVQQEMSVLFTDIRDFTTLCEEMTPKETFDFLNNYLGMMEPLISRNFGFIDKYIGDSIMALFMGNVENAIDAAIDMRATLAEFNIMRKTEGKKAINSGIGLHTGNLMLGVVGGKGRMDGTVVSDAVNLASRIEGLTKIYGTSLIISQDTLIKIEDPTRYNYRFLDVVKVKGKKEAVYIFEILDGEPPEIKKLKIETKADFGKAIQLYKNKNFDEAMTLFKKVLQINPDDRASKLYMARCGNIIDFGLPEDWDGVETIRDKY